MAAPRAVKDSDTALWLHNKLGSSEDLWVSMGVSGIIKTDTIDNIYRCFTVLTSTVKLKLLLGILHLPRRNFDEMKHTIEGLVELALDDNDQWVRLVADVVKTYPLRGKLNLDLTSNNIAASVIEQLREKVNDSNVFATLPLECQYVNKNALQSLVGSQPPPVRHFALKRKPKSAALRVDLMQRSSDASSHAKKEKTVPVKHRDMKRKFSDAIPMRGIPKAPALGHKSEGFRSQATPSSHISQSSSSSRSVSRFPSRSERGTKMLDISEQPIGIREQKRRKKLQQDEESALPSTSTSMEDKIDETPDYAAGLPQTIPPEPMDTAPSQPESDTKSDEQDEENDADMEDEDYDQGHYPPESPEDNNLSTIDQDPPTLSENSPPSLPEQKTVPRAVEKPPIEELPVYAMPATPSPYFRPLSNAVHPVVSTTPPARQSSVISSVRPGNLSMHPTTGLSNTQAPQQSMHNNTRSLTPSSAVVPSSPLSSPPPPSQNPPSVLSPTNISIGSTPNIPQRRHVSPPKNTTAGQNLPYPQTPGFYGSIIRQQAPQLPQNAQMPRQQPIRQPHTLIPPAPYNPQLTQIQSNTVRYVMRPNLMQLQQLRSQNPRFSAVSNASQVGNQPLSVTVSNTQAAALQQQLQLQQARMQQQLSMQQAQIPKKTLMLTREQMDQAQDMFKTANRLTRQEKSIILGFMAGSRDNPAPEKGDIIQITLSEHEQVVQNSTGGERIPVIIETFYEMNYRTGESAKKQRLRQYVHRFNTGNVK